MPDPNGISVSELNLMIAEAIRREPRTRSVSVCGEVSGFRHHIASGHWYFSLKDAESSISCVMFRQNTFRSAIRPTDGQSVLVTGYVDVYPRNGTYQLYITSMQEAGTGDAYARLEALKRKLFSEGLFDPSRKKLLPKVPQKVAVITSASGAALHDILNVSGMRCPFIPIVLVPVTVQGDHAGADIANAIRLVNQTSDADVIIVARGGGSTEDLWCFNDEAIVRSVCDSRIPVVSGVGHEIDITLCDLAADVRASTPSNAAEIVFPDVRELHAVIRSVRTRLVQSVRMKMSDAEKSIHEKQLILSSVSPERKVAKLSAESMLKRTALLSAVRIRISQIGTGLQNSSRELDSAIHHRTEHAMIILDRLRDRLRAINPSAVLDRGYALVLSPEGKIITRKAQVNGIPKMKVRFADGEIEVEHHG